MSDINSMLQQIIQFYNGGRNPQELMSRFMPNNLNEMKQKMQNMAQGRSPAEFIMQLARQNGASEQNLNGLAQILGARK
jgi:hypothetical protein